MNGNFFDVAIIGSGPAGLTAAIYCSRANLKTLVLAGTKWGGQLMQAATVENFPGFPAGIQGPDLMEKMKSQAEKFGAKIIHEDANKIIKENNLFLVSCLLDNYHARAVIIAAGAETQWLNLPNEQRLIGHGVSPCAACDAFFFKNKKVAVVGGGDSACEEALFLTKFASEVTIIHRRDQLRASKIMQNRVFKNPKIKILFNTKVVDILGKDRVEGLKIENLKLNSNLAADGVFVAIGHRPNDELLKSLESQEGIFMAGEIIDLKYKQAITAAGFGCQAALDTINWLELRQSVSAE